MQKNTSSEMPRIAKKIVPNLILGVLALSVGVLCFSPNEQEILTEGLQAQIYRSAGENGKGVSLMFNVYMGTDEIYQILDILQEYDAKATFFIGGCWADDNVACLRDIFIAGHEIGNHGYFHKQHSKLTFQQNVEEISLCNKVVFELIGVVPTLFAPPSGDFSVETLQASQSLACKTIMWTRDTIDWRDKDSKLILQRATKDIVGGEFILLHPTLHTLQSLEKMLQYYKSQNLTVATVSNNLGE